MKRGEMAAIFDLGGTKPENRQQFHHGVGNIPLQPAVIRRLFTELSNLGAIEQNEERTYPGVDRSCQHSEETDPAMKRFRYHVMIALR